MSERRTVEPSFLLAIVLLFVTVELWAIADRLMDIRDAVRAASAMSAGTAETHSGSGLQPASATPNGGDAQ